MKLAIALILVVGCSSSSSGTSGGPDGLYSTSCSISGGTPCFAPSDIVCVAPTNTNAFLAKYGGTCVGHFCTGGCAAIGTTSDGDTAYCCPPTPPTPLNPADGGYVQP